MPKTLHSEIFEIAGAFYASQVAAPEAQKYIAQRGHTPELIKKMLVGWTGARNSLLKHFVAHPWTTPDGQESTLYKSARAELLSSGLVREKDGKLYDFFPPGVVVFPLLEGGKINHFRFKDPAKKVAYQLPFEYKLNGQLFYNQDDLRFNKVILVEGENDVLTVKRVLQSERLDAGVIGVLGTFSSTQAEFLLNMQDKEFFCMFDRDDAGSGYVERFVAAAAGVLDVNIIDYGSAGDDPDSYLRTDGHKHLAELLQNAQEGISWQIFQLPDADSALKAKKFVKPGIDLVAKVKNRMALEMYVDDAIRKKYPSLKRPVVVELLQQAGAEIGAKVQSFEVYDSSEHIFVSENCFWAPTKDDKRRISNFIWRLTNIFYFENPEGGERYMRYEAAMTNYKGIKSEPIILDPDERVTVQKFVSKAASRGEFHFHGNLQDLMNAWSFVESVADDVKLSYMMQQYGFIPGHSLWLLHSLAIQKGNIYKIKDGDQTIMVDNQGYKTVDVQVYGGDIPRLNTSWQPSQAEIDEIVDQFWTVCDGTNISSNRRLWPEFKGIIMLGFVGAMVYRNAIMKRLGFFPLLCNYGPSQTGKSTVTQILFAFWGFSNPAETWESTTVAGLTMMLQQLSNLPVWIDEFRNNSNRRHKDLLGVIRNAYNGASAGKGGLRSRKIYPVNGVLWLSGEDTPDDRATLSRFVINRFTEVNDVRTDAYNWLEKNRTKLSAITVKLLLGQTIAQEEAIISDIEKIADALLERGVLDARTRFNYAVPAAGFLLFNSRLDDKEFFENFVDFLVDQAQEDILRKSQEDILAKFFEDMAMLMERSPFNFFVKVNDDGDLYLRFNEYYAEYQKELRSRGDNSSTDFKKSTLKDYIFKSPYFVKARHSVRFDSDEVPRKAIKLNIYKMPKHLMELFEDNRKTGDVF